LAAEAGYGEEEVSEAFGQVVVQAPRRFETVVVVVDASGREREVDRGRAAPDEDGAGRPVLRVKPRGWLFAILRILGVKVFRRMVRDLWNTGFTAGFLPLAYVACRKTLLLAPESDVLSVGLVTLLAVVLLALYGKVIGWDSVQEAAALVFRALDAGLSKKE